MSLSRKQRRRLWTIITAPSQLPGTAAGGAPILEWTSPDTDATPEFTIDFLDPQIGDVVTLRRATVADFSVYTDATDTIDTITPINALVFDFTPTDWANGTYYVKTFYTRGATESTHSNTETVIIDASTYTPTYHIYAF